MIFAYAQNWKNGKTTLHGTTIFALTKMRTLSLRSWGRHGNANPELEKLGEARVVGVDQPLLDRIVEAGSGLVWS